MLERVTSENFNQVYELLQESFPENEYRSYEDQKALLSKGNYRGLQYILDLDFAGFLGMWEFENLVFIEHLVVAPQFRSRGLGQKILRQIQANHPNQSILLEVELPEDDVSRRRIKFYQGQGFYLTEFGYRQPGYRPGETGPRLLMMAYPQDLTLSQFEVMKEQIFKEIYGD